MKLKKQFEIDIKKSNFIHLPSNNFRLWKSAEQ